MRFLIDTNILIPLEPTARQDLQLEDARIVQLARAVQEAGHGLLVHPGIIHDVRRNGDTDRRVLRERLVQKYPALQDPPEASDRLRQLFGSPVLGSNEWVDSQLLAAVEADAVDYLITNDRGIRRRAVEAGLGDRVLGTNEALELVARLFDAPPLPPPAVESKKAYALNEQDPILESLREDYGAFTFDEWLTKAKREHRQTWVIPARDADAYAGVCIVNEERDQRFADTKTLKICTFKISEEHSGLAYGELLLRTVFEYAHQNDYRRLYVTVFPKHEDLIYFLEQFGFSRLGLNALGEYEYTKPMHPPEATIETETALEYHVRYGPYAWRWNRDRAWVIPIKPRYHHILFPDAEPQRPLLPGDRPSGNSIRKAYLSRAGTRSIAPGDLLVFYRSDDTQALTVVGVAEETSVSEAPEDIATFVGKRTVYRYADICEMCSGGEVLAILFRYAHRIGDPVRRAELEQRHLLTAAPQSIQQLRKGDKPWLLKRLKQQ
ncbi:MAG: GNAT family N-acetyltransferase [Armatimonadota bacterium]|jgi:L-amino acid N-acyltransferase YncA